MNETLSIFYTYFGYWKWFLLGGIIWAIFLLLTIKNYGKYSLFLLLKHGYILMGGKFNAGKTRLLSQLGATGFKKGMFVISNFYFGQSFLNFSSKMDFLLLTEDLLLLGELQNYNSDDFDRMYKNYPREWVAKEKKRRDKIKAKYKYIPTDGYVCNIMLLGDEFHQYFHNRDAMSNFAGENKRFLTTIHQVRHFNTLMILATQDIDDLDLKFRKLAGYEIDTKQMGNMLFGFNLFSYNYKRKEENVIFHKINKLPIMRINYFALNLILKQFEKKINYYIGKWNKWKYLPHTCMYIKNKKFKEFKKLEFESKFNVDVSIDIYQKEDLFRKLNEFFKQKADNIEGFLHIT